MDPVELSGRASALTPYLEQLLYDEDVQSSLREAAGATREAWGRARGKSAQQALEDEKLGRRVQEALAALREFAASLSEPPAKRRSRRAPAVVALLLALGAGIFVALNPGARARIAQLSSNAGAGTENPQV